jgi:hypothetical protein
MQTRTATNSSNLGKPRGTNVGTKRRTRGMYDINSIAII